MPMGDTTVNDWLKLAFNSVPLSWAAITNFYIALHTANPASSGSQSTSECAYNGYARIGVSRNGTGGWTVAGKEASNAALLQFATALAGTTPETATHVSIGTAASGAGQIGYVGALDTPLPIATTIQPQFAAGALKATGS